MCDEKCMVIVMCRECGFECEHPDDHELIEVCASRYALAKARQLAGASVTSVDELRAIKDRPGCEALAAFFAAFDVGLFDE